MSLSIKNQWIDKKSRVYIVFTLENVMELFFCSERKASYLMKELDSKSGSGLIEKKRQGLGKPNLIYVKNVFASDIVNIALHFFLKDIQSKLLLKNHNIAVI